eukprot:scaffold198335_cov12-Tisochrysis_lutea.AAC.1
MAAPALPGFVYMKQAVQKRCIPIRVARVRCTGPQQHQPPQDPLQHIIGCHVGRLPVKLWTSIKSPLPET